LQFDAVPIAEADNMKIDYSLNVPLDFEFVKGGKLPGIYAGESLSGGDTENAGVLGTSLRLMWRTDGQMEVYMYGPIKSDDPICEIYDSHCNPEFGTSLMRGRLSLVKGQVNTISVSATMNDVGLNNGKITLTVNGKSAMIEGVTLRLVPDLQFSGIFFSTFFGGGDASWQSPRDQELEFSDFSLESW
jgi:hypothetical protein